MPTLYTLLTATDHASNPSAVLSRRATANTCSGLLDPGATGQWQTQAPDHIWQNCPGNASQLQRCRDTSKGVCPLQDFRSNSECLKRVPKKSGKEQVAVGEEHRWRGHPKQGHPGIPGTVPRAEPFVYHESWIPELSM